MIRSKVIVGFCIVGVLLAGCANEKIEGEKTETSFTSSNEANQEKEVVKESTEVKTEEITVSYPEPYIKAVEEFNSNNLELSLKYLDLTISDFKDTEYVVYANVLKSHILNIQITGYASTVTSYMTGSKSYLESPFRDTEGTEQIKAVVDEGKAYLQDKSMQLNESITYVLNNYNSVKQEIIFDKNIRATSDYVSSHNLDFFESVGYPIPSDDEIERAKESITGKLYQGYTAEVFSNNEVKYIELFYNSAISLRVNNNGRALSKPFFEEVLRLTEDDKYNEKRIEAEDLLKDI